MPAKSKFTLAYALSAVLALLLISSSLAGLLYGSGGLYEPYPASLAGLVGQDAITLLFGLPLLLVSTWLALRGSTRGLLLWAGTLFYFAYSYFFYLVGVFNDLFFLFAVMVAGSLALLVPYLRGLQESGGKPALPGRGLKGGLG
jgi:hypothetical protein